MSTLSSQKRMIRFTLITLHPNEYSQEFHCYQFVVKLDMLEFVIKYVLNKAEGLNLNVFNMITGINKSKTSIKHISCACKCRFNGKNVV